MVGTTRKKYFETPKALFTIIKLLFVIYHWKTIPACIDFNEHNEVTYIDWHDFEGENVRYSNNY